MDFGLLSIFFAVALAHFLALLSPGPDFVLVVKSAIKGHRKNAVGVALGITMANATYIGLCLIGIGAILAASVSLMIVLKIIGGLFLLYLAFHALKAPKSAYRELTVASNNSGLATNSFMKECLTGFMSSILNPKNLLFYLSLFTVVLTPEVSLNFKILLSIWMTLVVFFWDVTIIYLLSKQTVRNKFTRLSFYIDKVTGVILGALGISIVKSVLVKQ